MNFNSSVLSSSAIIRENNDNKPVLYELLEMNDNIHDLCIENKIRYYRCLTKSIVQENSDILNESIVSDSINALIKIIENIINFVSKSIRYITEKYFNNYRDYKILTATYKSKFTTTANDDTKVDTLIFYYPTIDDISNINISMMLLKMNTMLAIVLKSGIKLGIDDLKENTYKSMAKALDKTSNKKAYNNGITADEVVDSESFHKYLLARLFYKEVETMSKDEWADYYYSLEAKVKPAREFSNKTKNLDKNLNDAINTLRQYKNAISNTDYEAASKIIECMKEVIADYILLVRAASTYQNDELKYNNNIFKSIITKKSSVAEAGFIHGEKFDSDTLFDNEDLRDFNRTEWLDLNITTEIYEIKYNMMESYLRKVVQESIILTDNDPNKYNRLLAMQEAENTALTEKINAIIERIKKLMETFINKVKDAYSENSLYIRKNAKIIENKITISEAASSGDILAGMYRVQKPLTIVPFNYDTMKNDLVDKETFFKARILNTLRESSNFSKRTVKWEDGMSIAEYCKAYYGASMPENKYPKCTFTSNELESNKKNITEFLQNTNYFSARNDLRTLDNEAKKAANRADMAPNNNENNAKNEAYYLNLFDTYLTEIELTMGNTNGSGEEKDNTTNSEANALRVYLDCYKDVILAKMTASEFIATELMALIKAHVNSYSK